MARKKKPLVALFVDVPSLHQNLRSLHHRPLDAAQLRACAEAHGKLDRALALADWDEVPSYYPQGFEAAEVERLHVARVRLTSGRRREVVRDLVPLELLSQVIELLFRDDGPEVGLLMIATADPALARIVSLVRERFQKDVVVLGVEGALPEELSSVATGAEVIPMPAVEPTDLEGLERLVPLLEELERRKRYLNFKYIRESTVRKLDFADRSFEAAERLLSEAISCGLLEKRKIDDKYKPGQHFTAYALNRECEWFARFGSGEPAPVHEDPPEGEEESESAGERGGRQSRGSQGGGSRGRSSPQGEEGGDERERKRYGSRDRDQDRDRDQGGEEGEGRKRKRRRRRKKPSGESGNGNGAVPQHEPPITAQLAAGSASGGKKGRRGRGRKGQQNHNQDRVGRAYEAPSRFLQDPSHDSIPNVSDDDIDEDRIMRALGNL